MVLGKTLLKLEKPEEAVIALTDALKITPAAVFHLDLGRAYVALGKFKMAGESFAKALSLATDLALKKEIQEEQERLRKKACRR